MKKVKILLKQKCKCLSINKIEEEEELRKFE